MSSMICGSCLLPIREGKYFSTPNLTCHAGCFKCADCNQAISGSYSQSTDTRLYYHPDCLSKLEDRRAVSLGHVCKQCSKPCYIGTFVSLSSGDRYHATCFTCHECSKTIEGQYIPYGTDRVPLHAECARKRDCAAALAEGRICRACKKPCFEGRVMTVSESERYHAQCFVCEHCKKMITGRFAQHGDAQVPYHVECLPRNITTVDRGHPTGSHRSKPPVTEATTPRWCKKCKLDCITGKFYTTSDGDIYHADCFRCSDPKCDKRITGPYALHGVPPQPYHADCGKQLFAPRCCLCSHAMDGHYYRHPFFENEEYCLSHEGRTTCFACARREPLPSSHKEGFVDLLDGRSLCAQCSGSIIVDASEAVALYHSIVDFMGSALGLSIPAEMRDVPILLVDVQTLNENRGKLNDVLGHHSADELAATTEVGVRPGSGSGKRLVSVRGEAVIRGVTLSRCSEVRHMPTARLSIGGGRNSLAPGQLPQVYRVTQTRDVLAVLVLYGLPRDLTASILAHEAMHVWLKLNKGFPFRMPPKLEEGLCQVIAYLYLESLEATGTGSDGSSALDSPSSVASTGASATVHSPQPRGTQPSVRRPSSAGSRTGPTKSTAPARTGSKRPKTLLAWFRQQIATDKSPVYGEGFKEAYAAVTTLGLKAVLSHIQQHQVLPPASKSAARWPSVN
jgi:hypothetical protein